MKFFTIIAVVCYLFVVTNCLPTLPSLPNTELINQCSQEKGVSLEDANQLVQHLKEASNQKEKCLLSCYLKGSGYYVNGKVDFDKMLESHKKFLPAEQQKELERIFKDCKDNFVYDNKDECQVAYDAYRCALPNKSQMSPSFVV
uniref:Heme-binding protein n=1 Tax=Triatoma infestans TaxID=30076 RepID=A6YPJ9_TRIIF|nr:heme-binding protein [Triatoma infestans]